jgi:hypothetical protein
MSLLVWHIKRGVHDMPAAGPVDKDVFGK